MRASSYVVLGADGFGRSEARKELRRFFEVDAENIALSALPNWPAKANTPKKSSRRRSRRWDSIRTSRTR